MSAKTVSKRRKAGPQAPGPRPRGADRAGQEEGTARRGKPYLAAVAAWLVPGAGHLLLGRWQRALAFFVVIIASLALGCHLEGRLPWVWSGSPLQTLASLGSLGSGLPYLVLRFGFGFEGEMRAVGYEYGSAFILTAGLMNLLLILDVWDIAQGRKE